jgi:peptidoglycan/xylan/chitin deacetylase (PgdA/CDA1 family)
MSTFKQRSFVLSSFLSRFFRPEKLRAASGINLLIPVYHSVVDEVPEHLKYLYLAVTEEEFRRDLEILLKHYHPISLEELIEIKKTDKTPDKPVFHLTFDGGLSEFYTTVAPILQQKGVPTTCFLNNAFIDNHEMFFRFKASVLIDYLHHQPMGSPSWEKYHQWANENGLGTIYYRKVLLSLDYNESATIEALAKRLSYDFTDYLKKQKPYMTSDEINELIGKGFTFGAHTSDHVRLSELPENEQVEEVKKSIDDIANRFNLKYKVFSFPFTDEGIAMGLWKELQKHQSCDLSFGCAGVRDDAVPINLQRFPVELYQGSIKTNLKKEYLYYLYLKMTGRNKIKR